MMTMGKRREIQVSRHGERRAYLKRQITADEYMSLRRLAIAGYVREADRRLEETIKAKYTREVF